MKKLTGLDCVAEVGKQMPTGPGGRGHCCNVGKLLSGKEEKATPNRKGRMTPLPQDIEEQTGLGARLGDDYETGQDE